MTRLSPLDGLRGIAILLVLFYHASPLGIGHIGVDIFFVLSGFVLTISLARNPDPAAFLNRRFWRLLPAIFFLTAVVALTIPLFFSGYASFTLGRMLEALTFTSAYTDAQGADYFVRGFSTDIFAHAWSLSVEMAMVFIFAAGALLMPFFKRWRAHILLALITLSALAFVIPYWSQAERFHLFPFRFWAFGLGVVAAALYLKNDINHPYCAPLGFLLLTISLPLAMVTIIGASTLATLGTFLILVGRWPIWLSFKPLVYTGLISYGLYLWHLPIYIIGKAAGQPYLLLVAFSFIMGAVSWHLIEKPLKSPKPWGKTIPGLLFPTFAIAIIGSVMLLLIPNQPSAYDEAYKHCHLPHSAPETSPCLSDSPDILLWGDSHAGVLAGALLRHYKNTDTAVSIVTRNGCPPAGPSLMTFWTSYPTQSNEQAYCAATQAEGLKQAAMADTIIINIHWTRQLDSQRCPDCQLLDDMNDLLTTLNAQGKTVYLVGPVPEPGWPTFFVRDVRHGLGMSMPLPSRMETAARTTAGRDWLTQNNHAYFDPFEALCTKDHCPVVTPENGYIFFDKDHMAPGGADAVISALLGPVD